MQLGSRNNYQGKNYFINTITTKKLLKQRNKGNFFSKKLSWVGQHFLIYLPVLEGKKGSRHLYLQILKASRGQCCYLVNSSKNMIAKNTLKPFFSFFFFLFSCIYLFKNKKKCLTLLYYIRSHSIM